MDISRFTLTGSTTPFVAVSLERSAPCNLHAGIIYRYRGRLRRVHFAWHRRLVSEEYISEVPCAMPELDIADELWLAKYFQKIATNPSNDRTIPYNLKHDEAISFDPKTGEVDFGVDSTGLGCATFVVAAFRSGGTRLIDPTGWPPATFWDRIRRSQFVNALLGSSDPDKQSQGRRITHEISSPCIAPQHVAGACLENEDDRPAKHPACDANGTAVVAIIDGASP